MTAYSNNGSYWVTTLVSWLVCVEQQTLSLDVGITQQNHTNHSLVTFQNIWPENGSDHIWKPAQSKYPLAQGT